MSNIRSTSRRYGSVPSDGTGGAVEPEVTGGCSEPECGGSVELDADVSELEDGGVELDGGVSEPDDGGGELELDDSSESDSDSGGAGGGATTGGGPDETVTVTTVPRITIAPAFGDGAITVPAGDASSTVMTRIARPRCVRRRLACCSDVEPMQAGTVT